MKPILKGVLLAVLQLALVASLGVKLLYDRATRPRLWVKTVRVDPDFRLHGRYLALRIEVRTDVKFGAKGERPFGHHVRLKVQDGELFAEESKTFTGVAVVRATPPGARAAETPPTPGIGVLREPVNFYVPPPLPDPSVRQPDEELWVEVTVPKQGPPRPIRLGVKREGQLTPLDVK